MHLLHLPPKCHALFDGILVNVISQRDEPTTSLYHDCCLPHDNALGLRSDQTSLLINLGYRHKTAQQGTQLLETHLAE